MSVPRSPTPTPGPSPRFWRRLHLGHWFLFGSLLVLTCYDLAEAQKDLRENPNVREASAAMFAVPNEIQDRYASCHYHYLVVCDMTPLPVVLPDLPQCRGLDPVRRQECNLAADAAEPTARSVIPWSRVPFVGIALTTIETVPRIPDALIHVLVSRWRRDKIEFSVGLFYAFAWIAMMAVSLRQKYPDNLLFLAIAVLAGPYLLEAAFWLLKAAFHGESAAVQYVSGQIVGFIGTWGCAVLAVTHDLKEAKETIKTTWRLAMIRRL